MIITKVFRINDSYKKMIYWLPLFLVYFLLFLPMGLTKADEAYSFAVVPQFEPRKLASIWIPILDKLTKNTGVKFELSGSKNIPAFEQKLINGECDFAYMNPYHAMLAIKADKYVPLIRDGGRLLYGILVVNDKSPVTSVNDLDGKKIAFPAPNALGASLLMRADLDQIHHIKIKPLYVQTHSSAYLNVIIGETVAGGGVMSTFKNQSADIKNNLRILYKTRTIFPHPIASHKRIPLKLRHKVCQAFLDMNNTPEGKVLLREIPIKRVILTGAYDYIMLSDWNLEDYYVKNK